jgi:beta-glucosidase
MKHSHKALWITLTSAFGLVCVVASVAWALSPSFKTQLDTTLNVKTYKTIEDTSKQEDTEYFKSAYTDEELAANENELCSNIEAEGASLLKNENATLPLSQTTKFSLFSTSSVDPVYGGTGSGQVNVNDATSIVKALNDNFEAKCTNSVLRKHYLNDLTKYRRVNAETTGGTINQYKINEAPWNEVITSDVESSFADYGDVALVFIARSGGEGNDLPMTECSDGINGDYLRLNQNEIDMLAGLKAYKDKGVFKKIVVLLNGSNTVSLDFINDAKYGIDAALWIGDPGMTGFNGVAKILRGSVNPSGRLSDTFLLDNKKSPVIENFGLHAYTNSSAGTGVYKTTYAQNNTDGGITGCNQDYIVYQEGIYVGYKYFETRYEDYVLNSGNAGTYKYSDLVAYPFGYGLSYTDFDYSNLSVKENGSSFDVKVTVTNSGSTAGKNAVELYVQSPYTQYDKDNKVEKASVQLGGFGKTGIIEPGKSEEVSLTIKKQDIASYDANLAKTYILDQGDYYFTVGKNAHDAVNNILAKKGYAQSNTEGRMDGDGKADAAVLVNLKEFDDKTCSVSQETGYKITNRFDHADLNKYEGTKDTQAITYLSRSNWKDTYPSLVSLSINDQMWKDGLTSDVEQRKDIVKKMEEKYYGNLAGTKVPAMGQSNGLTSVMFRNVDFDDQPDAWEKLISQASYAEMTNTVYNGFHLTVAIPSLSLPGTADENGPQGYTKSLTSGVSGMAYTSEDIMASTRNVALVKNMGEDIAEDCMRAQSNSGKTAGLYGPACNIHRTQYCGRNFEYYSEDSLLSAKICEPEVRAIQSKGVYVFTKHFALNDQESGRYGLSTWSNEQAIRETYLRSFEGNALGGGSGVMSSFNRFGVVWSGADYSLMTEVLRNEWGMKGMAITDCSVYASFMDVAAGTLAGQNIWDGNKTAAVATIDGYENDPIMVTCLQSSVKRIVYSISHSFAMNGISGSAKIVSIESWWLTLLKGLSIGCGIIALGSGTMLLLEIRRKKKEVTA